MLTSAVMKRVGGSLYKVEDTRGWRAVPVLAGMVAHFPAVLQLPLVCPRVYDHTCVCKSTGTLPAREALDKASPGREPGSTLT